MTPTRAVSIVLSLLVTAATLIAGIPAAAHPLGNFTINHLVKVDVEHRAVRVRYVLDMAEIPTFQAMRARSLSGTMDARQLSAWARDEVAVISPSIDVEADGRRLVLTAALPHVTTRPGAGGLPTLYWVDDFRAPLVADVAQVDVNDATFSDRIGWKDVVVAPQTEPTDELRHYPSALLGSPRNTTSVHIDVTPNGPRVTSRATGDAGPSAAAQASQIRSNALSDMLARGASDPLAVMLTLLAAIGLGALHAAEPGHGKTLLAVSLVGARATPKQALLLAVGLTIAHTAGVLLLGAALIIAAGWIVPETIYPWVTLVSGSAVAMLGAGGLARFVRARRASGHIHAAGGQHHAHHHEQGEHHHQILGGDAPLSFRAVMLVAMSGNIAPCPAALVVMLAALALHEVGYGVAVVVAFSIGLAAVLTALGIGLVRGAAWISQRPALDKATAYAPLVSACVIALIGAAMLGQSAAAGLFSVPPIFVTSLALLAIAVFALAPGHTHGAHAHGSKPW